MSIKSAYVSFKKNRPKTVIVLQAFLVLFILLTLLRLALPSIIKTSAISVLESQGLEASIESIELSFTDAFFSINKASGKNRDSKGFTLDRLSLRWQWKPLLKRIIVIDLLAVDSLNIDTSFFDDGKKIIAGIALNPQTKTATPEAIDNEQSPPWQASIKDIKFSKINLCLQQISSDTAKLDYCARLEQLRWDGEIGFKPPKDTDASQSLPLYIQGSLTMNGIDLHNNQLDLALLKLATVDIDNIDIKTPDNITINDINLSSLVLMQRKDSASIDNAQLFSFDKLAIHDIKLSQLNTLRLKTIALEGTRSYLTIAKDGTLEINQWLPEQKKAAAQSKNETAKNSGKPFVYAFDVFTHKTKHHHLLIDNSQKEPFSADIHDIDLTFTPLDSNHPDNISHLSLALTINKYGLFKMDADINPLSKNPDMAGKANLDGFDLKMFAPLSKQYIGHNIKSGQLDTDITLKINKGIIDSKISIALNKFELKMLDKKEARKINSEFGFPLNSSLSLLRDRDNKIRLEIPISGDIDKPQFDPRDAIIKATSKAISTAVLSYYTPFGLVFAAETLFDLATALKFDPILFDAGSQELSNIHTQQLDKLTELLIQRPGIHLTLCPFSANADTEKLFPKLKTQSGAESTQIKEEDVLSESKLTTLISLAGSRSDAVKNYLVADKKIKADRLIECTPEYKRDGISGVEISI